MHLTISLPEIYRSVCHNLYALDTSSLFGLPPFLSPLEGQGTLSLLRYERVNKSIYHPTNTLCDTPFRMYINSYMFAETCWSWSTSQIVYNSVHFLDDILIVRTCPIWVRQKVWKIKEFSCVYVEHDVPCFVAAASPKPSWLCPLLFSITDNIYVKYLFICWMLSRSLPSHSSVVVHHLLIFPASRASSPQHENALCRVVCLLNTTSVSSFSLCEALIFAHCNDIWTCNFPVSAQPSSLYEGCFSSTSDGL